MEIAAGDLTLRTRALEDLDEVVAEMSDPSAARWNHVPFDKERLVERLATEGVEGHSFVARDAAGTLVGASGLHWGDGPRNGRVNLGWWVARSHRGRGAAVQLARAVADWGLDQGLTTIVASCTEPNIASRLTALHAGMVPEAVLLGGGVDHEASVPPSEHTYVRTGPPVPAQPGLAAGDLSLRPWRVRDAAAVLQWTGDPASQEFTSVPVPYDLAMAVDFTGPAAATGWNAGTSVHVAIWRGLQIVGDATVRRLSPGVWDVGCVCAPSVRGQGLVPRAVDALVTWLFGGPPHLETVHRVEWHARVDNDASIRAAQKAGFVADGVRARLLPLRDGSCADGWVGVRLRP